MFTADAITENCNVIFINASFGLGKALVSRLVSVELYKVKKGNEMSLLKRSRRRNWIFLLPEGGNVEQPLPTDQETKQVLTDSQIITLAEMGGIEGKFSTRY
ncbi:phosphoenolpyruvate synthase/pyruvate phosphate dikinase [Bacillus sp. RC218]|uniref:PEP/pyruvate-binding domain-containing protein n=1 Tax=unclassified Bacillus (in: firmicutes) TaxID=185979 RepID=UPI0038356162